MDEKELSAEQLKIQDRQLRATRHYLRGRSARWIGDRLNVSHTTILRDLRAVQDEWRKEAIDNLDAVKSKELQKLDELEFSYWQAWRRSIGQRTRETSEMSDGAKGDASRIATVTEVEVGDPRFLAGVERCIERRCKLLGLDAPVKVDATHRGVLAVDRELVDAVMGNRPAAEGSAV